MTAALLANFMCVINNYRFCLLFIITKLVYFSSFFTTEITYIQKDVFYRIYLRSL